MNILPSTLKTQKLKAPNFPFWSLKKCNLGNIVKHERHFNQILSHAIASGLFKDDAFTSSKLLLHSLSSHPNNDLSFSRSLFFQIQNPNLFAYNFMFKAFAQSPDPKQAIALYNLMLENGGVSPDNYTFPYILKACGRLKLLNKGQEVHCLSIKLGLQNDVFVQNGLISMYCFCGVVEMASKVFDLVSVRDVVTWNSMISGCLNCDWNLDALKVFGELLGDNRVRADAVTFIGALTACGRLGLLDSGKKVHALVLRNGFDVDVFLGSSLIDMYAKCGKTECSRKVFDRIPERNLVCWTSVIVGYARQDRYREAIDMFREMQVSGGVVADAALAACVISACGNSGALDQGRWVHSYCERNDIGKNLSVKNALIDMYSKCGEIEKAVKIFNQMVDRDVVTWTAIISGLAVNGNSAEALELFAEMELLSDVRPNEVTFLGVLSACSHGGFVDKGFQYFKAMSQIYGITPRIEHYGCMVDLFGRANLMVETEKFIKAMPIQPDVVIWRSLLFACRSHGYVELAELAIRNIEKLEPRQSDARVLLSNAYASASRWVDASRIRKGMARQKIQKQPGCSFVEISSCVHEFFTEDGSHCQTDAIYETNRSVHKVLRSTGFDTDGLDN